VTNAPCATRQTATPERDLIKASEDEDATHLSAAETTCTLTEAPTALQQTTRPYAAAITRMSRIGFESWQQFANSAHDGAGGDVYLQLNRNSLECRAVRAASTQPRCTFCFGRLRTSLESLEFFFFLFVVVIALINWRNRSTTGSSWWLSQEVLIMLLLVGLGWSNFTH
jgi:hypothetical protein